MVIGVGDSAYALIKDIQNSNAVHNKTQRKKIWRILKGQRLND